MKNVTKLMAVGLLLLIGVVLLLLYGCSAIEPSPTATPAPTETPVPPLAMSADDVIGIWQIAATGGNTRFLQFDEDGTYRVAQRVISNLEDGPQFLGPFTLDGGLMTVVGSDEDLLCAGKSGTYEVHLLEQGRLGISVREDECSIRSGALGAGEAGFIYEPYSP